MRRKPAVHVTLKALQTELSAMGFHLSDSDMYALAFRLRGSILHNRQLINATNMRTVKALERKRTHSQTDSEIAAAVYAQFSLKHFSRPAFYGPHDTMWGHIENLAQAAKQFADHFEIDSVNDAVLIYLETARPLLGHRFKLPRLKAYSLKVMDAYEAALVTAEDDDKQGTKAFAVEYAKQLLKYANVDCSYLAEPEYAMHIVYGRTAADDAKAKYKDWINAQAEGLEFANTFPEVTQLYGKNADARYRGWCKKHKRTYNGSETNISRDYLNKLRELRDANRDK